VAVNTEAIFLNAAGTVLFVRDDMESGEWTQEEYSVNMTFPFDSGKVIQRGMRVAFRDPATNTLEMFEIRNVTNIEPDHYQQIIGEHIALSELSDDHIDTQEIDNKTAAQALTTVLTGTLWAVGNDTSSGTSSVDIARGSVWQAVNAIQSNWNVYITPRVTLTSAGAISGRYLDIAPAVGVWRGLRLSIDKNIADSSVIYDDSEVLTALYGYGGTVDKPQTGQEDTQETLTFKDVVWSATAEHPAKPSGQTYLEDPAKTALYGRNGRARFGYYQNADIKDANTLLQKTWEALKQTSDPKISISGTVADLYRLGYTDQPLRLHDTAIVDITPTGEAFQKQIIRLTIDLIDPTASRPEIGDYIPNIIYINRETNVQATTGGRGGGGGGRGSSTTEYNLSETYSGFEKTDNMIAMVVGTRNGDNYIKAGEIGLAINRSGQSGQYESTAYINADHVNISATQTAHTLAGDIEHDASGKLVIKNAGGLYVRRTESGITSEFGVWDNGNVTAGMIATVVNGVASTYIKGDKIMMGNGQDAETVINGKLTADQITATLINSKYANADFVAGQNVSCGSLTAMGAIEGYSVGCSEFDCGAMSFGGGTAFSNCIISASVSGNTLTLTPASGSPVTFSKATTQSGAWASGVFTATARQNGVDVGSLVTSLSTGATTWSGNTATVKIMATVGTSPTLYETGETVTVDASSKVNAVIITSVTAPAGTSESGTVTATASNGNTKAATISASGGGFADGGVYAYANLDGVSAARKWIALPETATWSHQWVGTQAVAVTCNVGGKAYNAYFSVGG
jgi:phage minor structural protein